MEAISLFKDVALSYYTFSVILYPSDYYICFVDIIHTPVYVSKLAADTICFIVNFVVMRNYVYHARQGLLSAASIVINSILRTKPKIDAKQTRTFFILFFSFLFLIFSFNALGKILPSSPFIIADMDIQKACSEFGCLEISGKNRSYPFTQMNFWSKANIRGIENLFILKEKIGKLARCDYR